MENDTNTYTVTQAAAEPPNTEPERVTDMPTDEDFTEAEHRFIAETAAKAMAAWYGNWEGDEWPTKQHIGEAASFAVDCAEALYAELYNRARAPT